MPPRRTDCSLNYLCVFAQARHSDVVRGQIGKQRYVALNFDAGDGSPERQRRILLIARVAGANYAYVTHFQLDQLDDFIVRFGNESLYLRLATAHHGVSFSRYQFRLRDGEFWLVDVEDQSITLTEPDRNGSSATLWLATSANLLTQTAVYRAQLHNEMDQRAQERATRRFNQGLLPTQGKVRAVRLHARRVPEWNLAHFDPYVFRIDFLCHYYDAELVFRSTCGR